MRKVKRQMFNVMTDPTQGRDAARFGKGGGRESDMDASEETFGEKVATGGRCLADGTEI